MRYVQTLRRALSTRSRPLLLSPRPPPPPAATSSVAPLPASPPPTPTSAPPSSPLRARCFSTAGRAGGGGARFREWKETVQALHLPRPGAADDDRATAQGRIVALLD